MNRFLTSFEREHTRNHTHIDCKVRHYFGNIQKKECEISLKMNGVGLPLHKSAFLCNRKAKRLPLYMCVVFCDFSFIVFSFLWGAGAFFSLFFLLFSSFKTQFLCAQKLTNALFFAFPWKYQK